MAAEGTKRRKLLKYICNSSQAMGTDRSAAERMAERSLSV
jgi:hypothetical protein